MENTILLFDLDSAIMRRDVISAIAHQVGLEDQLCEMTEGEMRCANSMKQRFLRSVELFKGISTGCIRQAVAETGFNTKLVEFMQCNMERCYIVTINPDVWIEELLCDWGLWRNVYCSKLRLCDDCTYDVVSILDKSLVIRQLVVPFVAVGGSDDDVGMIEAAKIGIAYGGMLGIAPSVMECASHVIYEEDRLVDFLERLV